MRTGEVAELLKVAQGTVVNWVNAVPAVFSESARGEDVTQRRYTDEDVNALQAIKELRTTGVKNWSEIAKRISEKATKMHHPASDLEFYKQEATRLRGIVQGLEAAINSLQRKQDLDRDWAMQQIALRERQLGQNMAQLQHYQALFANLRTETEKPE